MILNPLGLSTKVLSGFMVFALTSSTVYASSLYASQGASQDLARRVPPPAEAPPAISQEISPEDIFSRTQPTPSSETISTPGTSPSAIGNRTRKEILKKIDEPAFQKELTHLGIKPGEVRQRLAGMTDRELFQVQNGVQRVAGGEIVVISTTVLLLVIIILLLV